MKLVVFVLLNTMFMSSCGANKLYKTDEWQVPYTWILNNISDSGVYLNGDATFQLFEYEDDILVGVFKFQGEKKACFSAERDASFKFKCKFEFQSSSTTVQATLTVEEIPERPSAGSYFVKAKEICVLTQMQNCISLHMSYNSLGEDGPGDETGTGGNAQ